MSPRPDPPTFEQLQVAAKVFTDYLSHRFEKTKGNEHDLRLRLSSMKQKIHDLLYESQQGL